ncbi:MAG: mechanosensitive ion channel family protein [Candidatus Magasanikbacteria bacterium]
MIVMLQQYNLWGNTAWDYTLALGVFIFSLVILKIFQVIILAKLRKLAKKTKTDVDDVLIDIFQHLTPPFYLIVSLYVMTNFLVLTGIVASVFKLFFVFALVFEAVRACQKLVVFGLEKYVKKSKENGGNSSDSLISAGKLMASIVLWSIGFILVLGNLGVDVTSLVASLGIGGIAIALAAQNILGDLFSSFSIYIDRPFEIGDTIVIGSDTGTVQRIGLKTTRLKTPRGEELIVSNKELTSVRVQNLKRMKKRKELFTLQVAYDTSNEKMKKIPAIVEEIITKIEGVQFDRCHFLAFNEFSLDFDVAYLVDTPEFKVFLDRKHEINLGIKKRFEKEGITFPYPTQQIVS